MTQEEIEKQAEEYFCEHCEYSFEHDNGHCSNCSKWDYFIAGAKWGMKQLCKTCEQRLKELGRPCAFRSLGNEYCWEKEND